MKRTYTVITYCRFLHDGKMGYTDVKTYVTKSVSCAMRRFFAERGDETDLLPIRVSQYVAAGRIR